MAASRKFGCAEELKVPGGDVSACLVRQMRHVIPIACSGGWGRRSRPPVFVSSRVARYSAPHCFPAQGCPPCHFPLAREIAPVHPVHFAEAARIENATARGL